MPLDSRHSQLLTEIVKNYIRGAQPVGSKALQGRLGVSSATIRHDMVALEEQGYLWQPHTSAGRVPTVKGFQFYLDNLRPAPAPKAAEQKLLRDILRYQTETENLAKELAHLLSSLAREAALVAINAERTYYTGLAYLFSQPEFSDLNMVREIGRVVDHLDDGLRRLSKDSRAGVQVRLGQNNPLGEDCAVIYTKVNFARQLLLLGLLGPVRMDYEANIARLNYVTELVTN